MSTFVSDIRYSLRMLVKSPGFTAVATTLLSGLFPAWRAGHTDPSAGLKEGGRRSAPRLRLGKVLVTAPTAMSVLFVVVGGLLCRTLINLSRVDPGFDTENLLLFPLDPRRSVSPPKDWQLFFEAVRRRIAGIPGVRSVAFANETLTSGPVERPPITIPGRPEAKPREALQVWVSDGYFATVGVNLLQGRDFLAAETEDSQVAIVNEEFARVFFPRENPLGQFVAIGQDKYQIVGLCRNQKCGVLRDPVSPIFYAPHRQDNNRRFDMVCLVRSVLPPLSLVPAVRRAVAEVDRSLLLRSRTP